jgi:hypothetical protein
MYIQQRTAINLAVFMFQSTNDFCADYYWPPPSSGMTAEHLVEESLANNSAWLLVGHVLSNYVFTMSGAGRHHGF